MTEEIMVRGNLFRAIVLGAEYNFVKAMVAYDNALEGMKGQPYFVNRHAYRNPGLILCMIKNGRFEEAEDLTRKSRNQIGFFERRDPFEEAELKALESLVLYGTRRSPQAIEKFRKAVPELIAVLQDSNILFERRRRADALLQAYIDMLIELDAQNRNNLHPSIEVANEIFQIADIQVSQVNSALGESIARAASLSHPELAELVRQEQDTKKRIASLQALLNNATAASDGMVDDKLVSLDRSIQSLVKARQTFLSRIEQVFPNYVDYIRPKPTTIDEVQALLASGEVYVGIWTLLDKTFVWVIPHQGEAVFKVVDMSRQRIAEKVARLRQALAPNVQFLSDVPEFDLEAAYELYTMLLRPVAPAWKNKKELIVVVKGPMDQIPIGILPTEPMRLRSPAGAPLFEGYEDVPWLIRKLSISRIPSAAALRTLRTMQQRGAARELFAGFGDPAFQPATEKTLENEASNLTHRGGNPRGIRLRGIRVVKADTLDNRDLLSVHLEDLHRLPDTADEIEEIARALGVDVKTNVFLGPEASEHRVKTENLSIKNILVFATHALLPGDLDGLTQPALAFSSPEVTLENEDGLLTMGEILTLKLDAELVVLSACDTGAGHGFGNEAISGLGRAFFYSGARSMAVTMWPVETVSAKKLTTSMFHSWRKNPKLSWAEALRQSMLQLMEGPGIEDEEGHEIARYAHPLFWAPFVVLGDL
jgi:CHAT domain-containing protein